MPKKDKKTGRVKAVGNDFGAVGLIQNSGKGTQENLIRVLCSNCPACKGERQD